MYDDDEVPTLTIIGVGKMGVAVVNKLIETPVYSASLLICHADADVLRSSRVPNKVLFEVGRSDDDARWHLTNAISDLELPGNIAIILSDLSSLDDYRQMVMLVQLFRKQGKLMIPTIGLCPHADPEQQSRVERMILDLQQQADSIWICTREQEAYLQRVDQMVSAVSILASFCESSIDTADFPDVKKIIWKARMAVAVATSKGVDRAANIVTAVVNQVQAQTMGGPVIDRILLITSTGKEKPLLLREQTVISNGISNFIGREVKIFKFGAVTDAALGEEIVVALLMGMPF